MKSDGKVVVNTVYTRMFLSMFHSVAGAGAAEKRGGAGEHPRVRQDEEQPAPDQAGDRRRGADHLKKTTTTTTTTTREGVWVWLIMRVFVGTETSGKCVCVCVRAEESVYVVAAAAAAANSLAFPTSCSFLWRGETLQSKEHPSVHPLARLPATDCQHSPPSHTHPAARSTPCRREGPNTDMFAHLFQRAESFQRAPMTEGNPSLLFSPLCPHNKLPFPLTLITGVVVLFVSSRGCSSTFRIN